VKGVLIASGKAFSKLSLIAILRKLSKFHQTEEAYRFIYAERLITRKCWIPRINFI